jgi:hypothetical protein
MTGWRLGWMIVPPSFIDVMNRLSQNMYINAPTLSQLAAVEAFSAESTAELEENVRKYAANREIVIDTLRSLGPIAANSSTSSLLPSPHYLSLFFSLSRSLSPSLSISLPPSLSLSFFLSLSRSFFLFHFHFSLLCSHPIRN